MADLSRTVEIVFGAIDNASSVITGLNTAIGTINDAVGGIEDITQPLADIGTNAVAAELALGTLLLTLGAFAVSKSSEWRTGVAEIASLYGGQADEVERLSGELITFAGTSNKTLEDIRNAAYIAISTGTLPEDLTTILDKSEDLAEVSNIDLKPALAALTRTMNAYGVEADDADRFSGALFTTVQNGDIDLNTLSGSIGKVATTASTSKVDIETLGSAIATMTVAGVGPDETMTKLRTLISELVKPSEDLETALGDLKFTGDNLPEVMRKLKEQTGGSQEKMADLFRSTESVTAALILSNDKSGTFTTTLNSMKDAATKVNTAVNNLPDDLEGHINGAKNKAFGALDQMGKDLITPVGTIVDQGGDIAAAFGAALTLPNFVPVQTAIQTFLTDLGFDLGKIADMLPDALAELDFTDFQTATGTIGTEIGKLFDDVDLTTPEGLRDVLQKMVDLGTDFQTFVAGVVKGLGPFVEAVKDAYKYLDKMDGTTLFKAGEVTGLATSINTIAGAVAPLTTALEGLATAATAAVAVTALGGLRTLLGGTATAAGLVSAPAAGAAAALAAAGVAAYAVGDALGADALGAAIGSGLYDLIHGGEDLTTAVGDVTDATNAQTTATEAVQGAADGVDFGGFSDEAGGLTYDIDAAAASIVGFNSAAEWVDSATDPASGAIGGLTKGLSRQIPITDSATGKVIGYIDELGNVTDELGRASTMAETAGTKMADAPKKATHEWVQIGNKMMTAEEAAKSAAAAAGTASGKINDSNIASHQSAEESYRRSAAINAAIVTNAETAKIAIETSGRIAVTEMETGAQRIESIVGGINSIIASTGDTIGSLAGSINGATNNITRANLASALNREQEIRAQAAKDAHNLAQIEIELGEAKLRNLQNGDALVTINADGLEPELEAFMWKIVERIQVRVAADQAEFLLGYGA